MAASVGQSPSLSTTTNTAVRTKAFAGAVSAGDVLWCATWQYSQANTCTGVGDSVNGANSWTLAGGAPINSAGFGNARLYIWYYLNSGAGTPTVTATWSGSALGQMAVASAAGYVGGGELDKFVSFGGASTFVNFTGPTGLGYEATTGSTGTLSQAVEVAFGAYTGDAGYGDQTAQGYTTSGTSDYVYSAGFSKVTAATTAISLVTGQGGASAQSLALITFKDAGLAPLAADQGSYSLTGQSAGLLSTRVLTAEQGSYSLSGQTISLVKETPGATVMPADYGQYTLTGEDALVDYAMNAAFGTYVLTGRTARLRWSGEPVILSTGQKLSVSLSMGVS